MFILPKAKSKEVVGLDSDYQPIFWDNDVIPISDLDLTLVDDISDYSQFSNVFNYMSQEKNDFIFIFSKKFSLPSDFYK